MAKTLCPICEQLVGISSTGEKQGRGTSQWWRIDLHAKEGKLCEGSGKKV